MTVKLHRSGSGHLASKPSVAKRNAAREAVASTAAKPGFFSKLSNFAENHSGKLMIAGMVLPMLPGLLGTDRVDQQA